MRVYLDNSATTPMAPQVLEAMLPYFAYEMGNAQSVHTFGQRARSAVELARRQVATLIGASPVEIIFVSGGTEADNYAVRGVAEAHREYGRHIVTSRIEHPAVLATCEQLEHAGFVVTYLPVSTDGFVRASDVRTAITDKTILVSIMHANNETGAIQPLEEIREIIQEARAAGAGRLHFHTDAVQAVGKIPIDVNVLGVDLLSLTGHKFHGPKGIGALFVRKGVRLLKQLHGGHHERNRRAGTENVPGIVGLGRAAELAGLELEGRSGRMRELRDYFEQQVTARIPDVRLNGGDGARLPGVSNMSFRGIDGESLLIALDLRGIAVSTGAACASGSLEPSHVLQAMGLSREDVRGSLRFSLGAQTNHEEIQFTLDVLEYTVARLRQMAPSDDAQAPEPRLS